MAGDPSSSGASRGPRLRLVGPHEAPDTPASDWGPAGELLEPTAPPPRTFTVRASACSALRRLRPSLIGSRDPLDQQLLSAIDNYLAGDLT